jgi:RNA polymerase sigma-70 factor (ECF subfamily)
MSSRPEAAPGRFDDAELARRCAARDAAAIRNLVTANNQRLFRTAWSILKDRGEAEDAVQAAYLNAFAHIAEFGGRSSISTWLVRITVNESLGRLRSQRRRQRKLEAEGVAILDDYREALMRGSSPETPDAGLAREQLRRLVEQAVDELPVIFRSVFVLRDVEELSVEETAQALDIPEATVKTRLLRARRRLREALAPEVHSALVGAFPFAGADCAAMTDRVMAALDIARPE